MSDPNFPPDRRNGSLILWRRVRDFICECFNLFGEPQDLAERHTLRFKDYKLALSWLRAGEALIRRFLLIEAALLEPQAPSPGPPAPSPASLKRARAPAPEDLKNPTTWRVSFRTLSSSPDRGGSGSRQFVRRSAASEGGSRETKGDVAANIRELSPRFRSALPIARRFEALLRVYNDPVPFARRLAARLRKTASLIKRIVKDVWDKCRGIVPRDFHDALGPCIAESQRLLTDSS